MMRFRREDFPALGRPINDTNPDFTLFPGVADLLRFVLCAGDSNFADASPFRVDDFDVKAIDIERLANCRNMA